MTNKNPSNELIEAIRLVKAGTGGHFYMWNLSGRSNAKLRAKIMGLLLGKKTPQAQSGINALIAELYRQCGVTGDCGAHADSNFTCYARGVLNTRWHIGEQDHKHGYWYCPICDEPYTNPLQAEHCLKGHGR